MVLKFATQVFVYRRCSADDASNSEKKVEEVLRKYRNVDKTRRREAARPWVESIVLEESSCCVWKCLQEFCIELIQCTLNKPDLLLS